MDDISVEILEISKKNLYTNEILILKNFELQKNLVEKDFWYKVLKTITKNMSEKNFLELKNECKLIYGESFIFYKFFDSLELNRL